MASEECVQRAVELMLASARERYRSAKEDAVRIAAFRFALQKFIDASVSAAAAEWITTMDVMPSVHEFVELARKHANLIADSRAISPASEASQTYPIGKPGREGLAAQIVMLRMLRAVAEQCPQGFWGRLGYGNDWRHATLQPEAGREERIRAYTTIAYEQAVDFEDSTLTWDRWPY